MSEENGITTQEKKGLQFRNDVATQRNDVEGNRE